MAESRWSAWMHNGRLSFLVWLVVLIAYCGFRIAGIEDATLTNTLIAFTGLLVGNLGIAQGQRQAKTEQQVRQLRTVAAEAHPDMVARDKRITELEGRADDSHDRESEWSQHQDHKDGGHQVGDDDA